MLSPGDIVLLDFPYTNQAGSKVRPGVIVGVNPQARLDDVNIAYMTSEVDSYAYDRFGLLITPDDLAQGTLRQDSVIRVDKVITVHKSKCRKVARLTAKKLDEVLRKATQLNVENFAANKYAPQTFTPSQTSVPPSGKLIDQGVAIWLNDLASGPPHGSNNLPYVCVGGCGGALATGKYIDAGDVPSYKFVTHNQFLNTIASAVGVTNGAGAPLDDFGDPELPKGRIAGMLA